MSLKDIARRINDIFMIVVDPVFSRLDKLMEIYEEEMSAIISIGLAAVFLFFLAMIFMKVTT